MSLPCNTVTLWTEAGPDVPDEVKGTNKYFHPERLEWRVNLDRDDGLDVYVVAHGPASRAPLGQGGQGWTVEGLFAELLPDWIIVPWDDIDMAAGALRTIRDEARDR